MLACELEEDAKALSFLKVRPHRSSIVKKLWSIENICFNIENTKIFDLGIRKITFLVRARASRPNKGGALQPSMMSRFDPGTYRFELRGS